MKCGFIYAITNKINGKMYIGKTTKKSLDERYRGDIRNTHNTHLRNSIEKYGIENFEIDECLYECDSEEELNEAEKFYIDYFNTANQKCGYNKTLGGDGTIPNEETRKKMSENHANVSGKKNPMYGKNSEDYMTEEAIKIKREKQSKSLKGKYCGEKHPMYNKHRSEETKQKISESLSGENSYWYGKHLSEETKKKISEALSGKNNPNARAVIQLDKSGSFIRKYDSISEASKELNITYQNIIACCKGRIKSAGGYVWKYLDDFGNVTTLDTLVLFLK